MYKSVIRPILFLFGTEFIHHFTLKFLKVFFAIPCAKRFTQQYFKPRNSPIETCVFGLHFKNPIGLAAGFDKNAKYFRELSYLGFGFVEIGTVTPQPQRGNPKKRLFRLAKDKAIINRMGFNNDGVDKICQRLKNRPKNLIIGGNIGKNKTTPQNKVIEDYLICFEKLFDFVDYFVVNVSSPNTPCLRDWQEKKMLYKLLKIIQIENNKKISPKPILLKIAPELNDHQLADIVAIVKQTKIAGIVATNTTVERNNLISKNRNEKGGLSGFPLKNRATKVIEYLTHKSENSFPIIGVGGIYTPSDAKEKIAAGASLLQIYSGLVYEGPSLIKHILGGLSNKGNIGKSKILKLSNTKDLP